MAEAGPGAGDIPIELDGQELILVPSLNACIRISRMAGGLNSAIQRCAQLDFETICEVVAAGLDANPVQAKKIPDAVFKTGMIGLHAKCIEFIHVVANGGRPPEPDEDQEGGEGPNPPNPA